MNCVLNCGKEFAVVYESHHPSKDQPRFICEKCLDMLIENAGFDKGNFNIDNPYAEEIGKRCIK